MTQLNSLQTHGLLFLQVFFGCVQGTCCAGFRPEQASILVVDDEPLIAMMIADWLVELGCQVVGPAGTVKDAMAFIEKGGLDGILLDVTLGSGNSFDIADRAQASLEKYYWLEEQGWFADCLRAAPGIPAAKAQVDDALRSNCLFTVSLGLVTGERARRTSKPRAAGLWCRADCARSRRCR